MIQQPPSAGPRTVEATTTAMGRPLRVPVVTYSSSGLEFVSHWIEFAVFSFGDMLGRQHSTQCGGIESELYSASGRRRRQWTNQIRRNWSGDRGVITDMRAARVG